MRAQLKNTAREQQQKNRIFSTQAKQSKKNKSNCIRWCHLQCLTRNSFSSTLPTIRWTMQKSLIIQPRPNQVQRNRKMDAANSTECHCSHRPNATKVSVPSQWTTKNQQTTTPNHKPMDSTESKWNEEISNWSVWWIFFKFSTAFSPLMLNYLIPIRVYSWKSDRIS